MPDNSNLAFLDFISGSRKRLYRTSKWLKSDFDNNVWDFVFQNPTIGSFKIDFNIVLLNGTLLTDHQNVKLRNTFKYWINASIHPDNTRGRGANYSDSTAMLLLTRVFTIIDYFLLNDQYLNVSMCGLQTITEDHLKHFFDQVTNTKSKAESVYKWSSTIGEYLIDQVAQSNAEELQNIIESSDVDFSTITDIQIEENNLGIPLNLIPLIRAWLWNNDLVRQKNTSEYEYNLVTTRLAQNIYGQKTLRGAIGAKPVPSILCFGESAVAIREYPRIPVREDDEGTISRTALNGYYSAVRALLLLRDDDFTDEELLLPPDNSIYALEEYSPKDIQSRRFKTLPSRLVFKVIKQAIEYHLKYANALLWSFGNLVKNIKERSLRLKYLSPKQFSEMMHPDIQELGVEKWSIYKTQKPDLFKLLRNNKGLCELIRVYYGGAAIVIGALMARRQAELASLQAGECIDNTGKYLIFGKAKSTQNLEGHRVIVARPIDEIAVEMVRVLEGIQEALVKHGYLVEKGNLFDTVSPLRPTTLLSMSNYKVAYNESIDYFCDYVEAPLWEGKRFYIRTHQLRRFFALSFFWGSGFGGMDTLRWFMGHTDPQHLYHYITENCPGEVLRHAKAQFAAETIEEHEQLASLIKHRYGTDDFTLISTDELEGYIDELICEGVVEIEPDFIEDASGQAYRIIVIVRNKYNVKS